MPSLTMAGFEERFLNFLLNDYHQRVQKDLGASPQQRWEGNGFLPRMPDTLEQLDLLLWKERAKYEKSKQQWAEDKAPASQTPGLGATRQPTFETLYKRA